MQWSFSLLKLNVQRNADIHKHSSTHAHPQCDTQLLANQMSQNTSSRINSWCGFICWVHMTAAKSTWWTQECTNCCITHKGQVHAALQLPQHTFKLCIVKSCRIYDCVGLKLCLQCSQLQGTAGNMKTDLTLLSSVRSKQTHPSMCVLNKYNFAWVV